MRKSISLLVALLMVMGLTLSAQATDYSIYAGTATVDGNLADWDGANWIDMNVDFYSEGSGSYDLTGAKWAAKWDSATNLIYVAVTGVDTDHNMFDGPVVWNGADMMEIYVDAANSDMAGYAWSDPDGFSVHAQQYGFGRGIADGTEWGVLSGQADPAYETLDRGVVAAYKTSLVGNVLSYEVAIKPYELYDNATPANSTEVALADGLVIGLDVIMSTKNATGFGMKCENNVQSKWGYADTFATYTLVGGVVNLPGDANGDGAVDVGDLGILAANYGGNGGWGQGDFNNDGVIDVGDLGILAANYGTTAAASVPEPATLLVLVGGGLLAGLKRKA